MSLYLSPVFAEGVSVALPAPAARPMPDVLPLKLAKENEDFAEAHFHFVSRYTKWGRRIDTTRDCH